SSPEHAPTGTTWRCRGAVSHPDENYRHDTVSSPVHTGAGSLTNGDKLDTTGLSLLLHLRNDTEQQILSLLMEDSAPSQSDIAGVVGISSPSVSWHMKRLIADGIVESYRDGRNVKYLLMPEAAEILGNVSRPGDKDSGTVQG
ncbi:MAG: hypothetical protein PWP08_1162, partial [Methanofollis sp.]|nr:hypothetical protein [Methanofollis sp.]